MLAARFDLALLLVVTICLGCGKSPSAESTDTASTQTADAQTATDPLVDGIELLPDESYPIDATANSESLLDRINELAQQDPTGTNDQEFVDDMYAINKSRLYAVEQILARESTEPALREAATIAKLDTLRILALIDQEGLGRLFDPFVESVIESGDKQLTLRGRAIRFQYELEAMIDGQVSSPDGLLDQLKTILDAKDSGESEFLATQYAGVVLNDLGYPDEATKVLRQIGERFVKSDDAELAEEARQLLKMTSFRESVFDAMSGTADDEQQLLATVGDLLTRQEPTIVALDTSLNAGQMMEYSGKLETARQIFDQIEKTFSDKEVDAQVREQAMRSIDYARKRLDLVGKPIEIRGIQLNGTPFDWSKLNGKVVLVDFWTSWSKPWRAQLSRLQELYENHHEAGLEIVGVNLDTDRQLAYEYLKNRPLGWQIVIDPNTGGFGNPNAIQYGVESVPFLLLVGRDGTVADIHLRGDQLESRVQELLRQND